MCDLNITSLILESDYGASSFTFDGMVYLFDVRQLLTDSGYKPSMLSASKGVARTFFNGSCLDMIDLIEKLERSHFVLSCNSAFSSAGETCPIRERLATLCNGVRDASTEDHTIPEIKTTSNGQVREDVDSDRIHPECCENAYGHTSVPREEQDPTRARGDHGDIQGSDEARIGDAELALMGKMVKKLRSIDHAVTVALGLVAAGMAAQIITILILLWRR